MQLDLFEDNRPNILLNIAEEYLVGQELEKALATCQQLLEEYPQNRHASELCYLTQRWHGIITAIHPPSCEPEQLKDIRDDLESVSHKALKSAVTNRLVILLQTFTEPDHIYFPPRFHLGHLLLDSGRFTEAYKSFCNALGSPDAPRGRFLAWSADALTLAGRTEDAVAIYLQAFLEDPETVEMRDIRHIDILELNTHCSFYADGIEVDGEAPWLPVWGWMQGLFLLPLHNPPVFDELETLVKSRTMPTPRLWFLLLTVAEYLRTIRRDDRQMASVRRLMKRLNSDMFESYMQKIRGSGQ